MENFKVGNFVTDGYDLMKVLEVKEESLVVDIFRDRLDSHPDYLVQEIIDLSELKYWTPKQGEWCWFWNNDKQPFLAQLDFLEEDEDTFNYITIQALHGSYADLSDTTHCFQYCEPFIGEIHSIYRGL